MLFVNAVDGRRLGAVGAFKADDRIAKIDGTAIAGCGLPSSNLLCGTGNLLQLFHVLGLRLNRIDVHIREKFKKCAVVIPELRNFAGWWVLRIAQDLHGVIGSAFAHFRNPIGIQTPGLVNQGLFNPRVELCFPYIFDQILESLLLFLVSAVFQHPMSDLIYAFLNCLR
jgi:hypothetical protein